MASLIERWPNVTSRFFPTSKTTLKQPCGPDRTIFHQADIFAGASRIDLGKSISSSAFSVVPLARGGGGLRGPDAKNQGHHPPTEMKVCMSHYSHKSMSISAIFKQRNIFNFQNFLDISMRKDQQQPPDLSILLIFGQNMS